MEKQGFFLLCLVAVVAGLPNLPIIRKTGDGLRYQYAEDADGRLHLVDLWATISDVAAGLRYNPDTQNVYHLFTRRNPSFSQVIVPGNDMTLFGSFFNATSRTAVLIHGWFDSALGNFNAVLVPAFLTAEDMNVIVVDWRAGSSINYLVSINNTITSGRAVARVINWINNATGADPSQYHIAGYSLGGQQAGIVGRYLDRPAGYVTGLDPAGPGWDINEHKFKPTDGNYTEIIHTSVDVSGYLEPLGQVDFYPNGGRGMPGCPSSICDHDRSFYYLAESLYSGGFTGRRCEDFHAALESNCTLPETLPMGGVKPKPGASGVYFLQTNAAPPFSRG